MPQLCSVVVFFLLLQGSRIPCHIVEVWLLLLLLRSRCLRRLLLCRVCARAGSPPQRSGVKEVLRGCAAWLCLSCRWLWLLPCLWAWWRCLLFWGWSPAAACLSLLPVLGGTDRSPPLAAAAALLRHSWVGAVADGTPPAWWRWAVFAAPIRGPSAGLIIHIHVPSTCSSMKAEPGSAKSVPPSCLCCGTPDNSVIR